MNAPDKATPQADNPSTEDHLTEAQRLLRALREKLDEHPELESAIAQIELALSKLTIKTGGLL